MLYAKGAVLLVPGLSLVLQNDSNLLENLKLCNAIKVLKGRGIAQLVERRSPKPQVPGSSPGAPAT